MKWNNPTLAHFFESEPIDENSILTCCCCGKECPVTELDFDQQYNQYLEATCRKCTEAK